MKYKSLCFFTYVPIYSLFELNIQSFEIPLVTSINDPLFKQKSSAELSSKFTCQISHNIRPAQKW